MATKYTAVCREDPLSKTAWLIKSFCKLQIHSLSLVPRLSPHANEKSKNVDDNLDAYEC